MPYGEGYNPVGNSLAVDLSEGCTVGRDLKFLLLGVGDIRNLLCTIHTISKDTEASNLPESVEFHLNDNNKNVLARDLLLLHLAKTTNTDDVEAMKFMWGIWYDSLLGKSHATMLRNLLLDLYETPTPTSDIVFGTQKTEESIKKCIKFWMLPNHDYKTTVGLRDASMAAFYGMRQPNYAVDIVSSRFAEHAVCRDKQCRKYCIEECKHFVETGMTRINFDSRDEKFLSVQCVNNPTFFEFGSPDWMVDVDSSPFASLPIDLAGYNGITNSVALLGFELLTDWVKTFQQFIRDAHSVKVVLWYGDAFDVCQNHIPKDIQFDFINTSNLVDWLGILHALVFCQNLLKRDNGILTIESFRWYEDCNTLGELIQKAFGIPKTLYPTVLGLSLVEVEELGKEELPAYGNYHSSQRLLLRWKKQNNLTTKITMTDDVTSS